MMRRLGTIQNDMMRSLQRRGFWFEGCGWIWDTHSGTRRLCESLCKRGLLVKSDVPSNVVPYHTHRYDLTMVGRAYVPYKEEL